MPNYFDHQCVCACLLIVSSGECKKNYWSLVATSACFSVNFMNTYVRVGGGFSAAVTIYIGPASNVQGGLNVAALIGVQF